MLLGTLSGFAWSAKINLAAGSATGDTLQQGATFVLQKDGKCTYHVRSLLSLLVERFGVLPLN